MTKSPRKNVPDVGIELGAACMPRELASNRATAPGLKQQYSQCYMQERRQGTITLAWLKVTENYQKFWWPSTILSLNPNCSNNLVKVFEVSWYEKVGYQTTLFPQVHNHDENHLRHDMTKPTKWVCVQRRLWSAWASTQSDQSLHCAFNGQLRSEDSDQPGHPPSWSESSLCVQWTAKDPRFLHADSEDWSDWADAQADLIRWGHTQFVGFVVTNALILFQNVNIPSTVMILFSDRQVWPNSADPDQTASLIRVYTVCYFVCIFWMHYSMVKPSCSNFSGVRIFMVICKP